MSKASEYARRAEERPRLDVGRYMFEVHDSGDLKITHDHGDAGWRRLDPKFAIELGRWLVETFGEGGSESTG